MSYFSWKSLQLSWNVGDVELRRSERLALSSFSSSVLVSFSRDCITFRASGELLLPPIIESCDPWPDEPSFSVMTDRKERSLVEEAPKTEATWSEKSGRLRVFSKGTGRV